MLSAGGKEVSCVVTEVPLDTVGRSLNQRMRVYGTAIHVGRSGVPIRLLVKRIKIIDTSPDIRDFSGSMSILDEGFLEGLG